MDAENTDVTQPPTPQLTFSEDEHKSLVEYLNFVDSHATFKDLNQREAYKFGQVYGRAVAVTKKIETHIFEFKRIIKQG